MQLEFSSDNFVILQFEMSKAIAFKYSLKNISKLGVIALLLLSVVVLPEVLKFNDFGTESNIAYLMDCDSSETTGSSGECEKDSFEDISDFLLFHPGKADTNIRSLTSNLYSRSSNFISFDELDVNSPPPENTLI